MHSNLGFPMYPQAQDFVHSLQSPHVTHILQIDTKLWALRVHCHYIRKRRHHQPTRQPHPEPPSGPPHVGSGSLADP